MTMTVIIPRIENFEELPGRKLWKKYLYFFSECNTKSFVQRDSFKINDVQASTNPNNNDESVHPVINMGVSMLINTIEVPIRIIKIGLEI